VPRPLLRSWLPSQHPSRLWSAPRLRFALRYRSPQSKRQGASVLEDGKVESIPTSSFLPGCPRYAPLPTDFPSAKLDCEATLPSLQTSQQKPPHGRRELFRIFL